VGASIGGLLLLAVLGFLVFGYRKRGRDLKHLEALARGSGKVEGRHELDGAQTALNGEGLTRNEVG
jgi:hypothetical protein